jgi:hypothetical protein
MSSFHRRNSEIHGVYRTTLRNIAEQQEVRASVEEIQDVLAQVGLDVRDSIVNGVSTIILL